MGRHPLSKTDTGKQIKDEDEANKHKYSDVFRAPGLVKIRKVARPPVEPGLVETTKNKVSHTKDGQLPSNYEVEKNSIPNMGNVSFDDKMDDFKKKVEKHIWMTTPHGKIYRRVPIAAVDNYLNAKYFVRK